jgi:DNA repair photolyase
MVRPRVTEVRCKSALNQVRGMPFRWSLNPYRGCTHHCSYCYARTTHAFLGFDVGEDFASQLFAKTNIAGVLRTELSGKNWRRETVAIGTSTDPYQPVEGQYRLTRACLETLADFHTPVNVTTKGTMVVRDTDVLQHSNRAAGAGVSLSLITLDEEVWRALEPGTPPPWQRLRALRRLSDSGIPCGIALAPILPGLTDKPASLEALIRAAAEHGAQWLWAGTIHLEPAVRDYFLACLAQHFPRAAGSYERVFGEFGGPARLRYTPKAYAGRVQRHIDELKARYGLEERRRPALMADAASVAGPAGRATALDHSAATPYSSRQLALPL